MCLSLEILTSIIRTGMPILVELIDLVNSVIIFLSQMTLLRWLTFLHGSQTVILTGLFFWIYFLLVTLVFVLQWLSVHWEILIIFLFKFPSTSIDITFLMTILVLIGMVFVIILEISHGRISLNSASAAASEFL